MRGFLDDFPPGSKDYRRKHMVWEASLSQETYTVREAAAAMKKGERAVRGLINSGELDSVNKGKRGTLIPKEAIIRYMIGPSPMEKMMDKAERKRK